MSSIVDLLSGEIERLFSTSEMKTLCIDYFDINPEENGIEDATKSVFARKIVDYCSREDALEALADAVMSLKGIPASSLEKTAHEAQFPDIWAVINRTTNSYNAKFRPEGGGAYK